MMKTVYALKRIGGRAARYKIPGGQGQSRTLDRLVHNQNSMAPLSGGGLKRDLNIESLRQGEENWIPRQARNDGKLTF